MSTRIITMYAESIYHTYILIDQSIPIISVRACIHSTIHARTHSHAYKYASANIIYLCSLCILLRIYTDTELSRVLFDALEEAFKGTESEHLIDELYAGELIDYIRCIDIDYETERVDKSLDFSLAIVPFGSTKAVSSLAQCLEMYLRPEMLDGDNQYYAESAGRKVDAIKGLKVRPMCVMWKVCNVRRCVISCMHMCNI